MATDSEEPDTDSEEPFIGGGDDQSEDEEDNFPIQNVPLEAKLQLKLEKRMKMKISKKVRLRRKRLMHRSMRRKRGRWPPSKMKKQKNVSLIFSRLWGCSSTACFLLTRLFSIAPSDILLPSSEVAICPKSRRCLPSWAYFTFAVKDRSNRTCRVDVKTGSEICR